VERGFLGALPDPLLDLDRRIEVRLSKDGFVRVGDVDYSLPPGLSGRRAGVDGPTADSGFKLMRRQPCDRITILTIPPS
jgi:hypothetical protein